MSAGLVHYAHGSEVSFGWLREGRIVDLKRRMADCDDLHDLVLMGRINEALALLQLDETDLALDDVRLLKPLQRWGKCLCVGVNYPERNEEYKDQSELPRYPSLFARFPESFTDPGQPLIRPPESHQLDYEGELAVVIGKPGRRIAEGAVDDHIFGYTIANEGSIRDWIRHGKFNVTPGKNWAASGALGPAIIPREIAPAASFRIVTRVNGEVRQDDTTDRMMFSISRIISYISTFCTLEPGDVILTGTPSGAGARFEPPRYLAPGDVVEVEVSGLGLLANTIADEPPSP